MNTSASTDVLAVFVDAGNVAAPLLGYEARPEGAQLAAVGGRVQGRVTARGARGAPCPSVRSPVGLRAGVDDQGVEEVCAHLTRQPVQVSGVPVVASARELDLNGHDLAVVADEDQVDLVIALASAQLGQRTAVGDAGGSGWQRLLRSMRPFALLSNVGTCTYT